MIVRRKLYGKSFCMMIFHLFYFRKTNQKVRKLYVRYRLLLYSYSILQLHICRYVLDILTLQQDFKYVIKLNNIFTNYYSKNSVRLKDLGLYVNCVQHLKANLMSFQKCQPISRRYNL